MSAYTGIETLEDRRLCAAGDLDTTFNGTGKQNFSLFADVTRVVVQPDQKVLVASAPDVLLHGAGVLQRYLPNGQLDPSFHDPKGSNTGYQVTALTTDIALTSNNEIVGLGGDSLMKLLPSGYHDPAFGVHGTAIPGTGLRMALTTDDKIVVAYVSGSSNTLFVRRYLADGTLDTTFGTNGDVNITNIFSSFEFRDIGVGFDGSVTLFGNDNINQFSYFSAIKLDANGHTVNSFGNGGVTVTGVGDASNQRVWAGIITPDNKLLIGGEVDNQMVVTRLTSSGFADTSFNGNGIKTVTLGAFSIDRSLAVGPDGRIYLGGRTNGASGNNGDFAVVRLNSNGSTDNTFSGDGVATADFGTSFDGATSIAVGSNNRVITGGDTYDADHFTQALRMGMAVFKGGAQLSDPDNLLGEARAVGLNSTTAATIGNGAGDVDMYKVTVVAGQRVSFQVTRPAGSLFDPYLRIFKSGGTQIASNDGGFLPDTLHRLGAPPPIDPYLDYTFTTAGTYFIGISSAPNTTYSPTTGAEGDTRGYGGAYSLAVQNLSNVFNSHDQISKAITPTGFGYVSSGFTNGKDVLMVKLSLTANKKTTIDLDSRGGSIDSYLRVFNAAGVQLASNDNGASAGETLGKDSYLEFTPMTSGTFYVGISASPNKHYNAVTGAGDVAGGGVGSFDVAFHTDGGLHFGPLVTMPSLASGIVGGLVTKFV